MDEPSAWIVLDVPMLLDLILDAFSTIGAWGRLKYGIMHIDV